MRFVLLLVAVLSGAAAAWLAMQMRPQPVRIVEPAQPAPTLLMQEVLVASVDFRPAQPLTKDGMRWQAWPQEAVTPVYITRSAQPDALETLSGKLVRNRMTVGEPIRNENLAPS